jgi:hypothetical protein
MSYFICVVPVCPVRAENSHRSEQVSQLLFGETAQLLEATGDFVRIKCNYDNYEGWCQASQLQALQDEDLKRGDNIMAADWVNEIRFNDVRMFVPFGSEVGALNCISVGQNKQRVLFEGKKFNPTEQLFDEETIRKIAFTYINSPYQWGGRSVFGVDCSGFTQAVFKFMNITLLRDASQQATQGESIGFLMEAKRGDLAFFDNEAGKITHVGILLDADTIIHASGKVRVDTIDNFGIVNIDTGKRTHTLRVIKRMVQ